MTEKGFEGKTMLIRIPEERSRKGRDSTGRIWAIPRRF